MGLVEIDQSLISKLFETFYCELLVRMTHLDYFLVNQRFEVVPDYADHLKRHFKFAYVATC